MKQIAREQFLDFKYLNSLKKNKQETAYAFISAQANLKDNNYLFDLYVSQGTKPKRLLQLKSESRFFWESATTILIPWAKTKEEKKAVEAQKTVLYRLDIETKKMSYADTLPIPVASVEVLEDGQWIVSTSLSEEAHCLFDEEKRDAYTKQVKEESFAEVFDEIPFYLNGRGFLRGARTQLFIYQPETKAFKAVDEKGFSFSTYTVDAQNEIIYYTGNTVEGVMKLEDQLKKYDLKQETNEVIIAEGYDFAGIYLLGSEVIVAASDGQKHGLNQNPDFYRVHEDHLHEFAQFGHDFGNTSGTDVRLGGSKTSYVENDVLYFISQNNESSNIVSLNAEGELAEIYFGAGDVLDGMISFAGQTLAIAFEGQQLQELVEVNVKKQTLKAKTSFNKSILKDHYVGIPEYLGYVNDGVDLDGWVILPKDYDESKTYPAILDIHGGPKTVYGELYYHEMQVWANEGYFVFFSNPRGGAGRDDEFADIRGKYGTIDYEDLMAFTDAVLEAYPAIDESRLGVTGGSYGGFMTNWIVGHTDRFKVAATQRSISNWISFYGTSDIGYYFATDQNDGTLMQDIEKLWDHSPMKYVENVKTPLLFIHSDEDYRCPIEQGLQFYMKLKHQGLETKFVWFKGENHELSRSGKPKARIKRLNEITDWMNHYLK